MIEGEDDESHKRNTYGKVYHSYLVLGEGKEVCVYEGHDPGGVGEEAGYLVPSAHTEYAGEQYGSCRYDRGDEQGTVYDAGQTLRQYVGCKTHYRKDEEVQERHKAHYPHYLPVLPQHLTYYGGSLVLALH